jgi:hypothetical protein
MSHAPAGTTSRFGSLIAVSLLVLVAIALLYPGSPLQIQFNESDENEFTARFSVTYVTEYELTPRWERVLVTYHIGLMRDSERMHKGDRSPDPEITYVLEREFSVKPGAHLRVNAEAVSRTRIAREDLTCHIKLFRRGQPLELTGIRELGGHSTKRTCQYTIDVPPV